MTKSAQNTNKRGIDTWLTYHRLGRFELAKQYQLYWNTYACIARRTPIVLRYTSVNSPPIL